MSSRVGTWVWQRLGGQVGEDGARLPDPRDPVVVFSGCPDQARAVKEQLESAGIAVVANARVADPRGLAVEMGVSPRPSEVQLEIRSADLPRATDLLESGTASP